MDHEEDDAEVALRYKDLHMADEAYQRTAQLRKLMRVFNEGYDERTALALVGELLSGGHELIYPTLTIPVDGEEVQMALAVPSQGLCSLGIYTSLRFTPPEYKVFTFGRATVPDLIERAPKQNVNVLVIDGSTTHCTGLYLADGNMKLLALHREEQIVGRELRQK